MKETDDIWGGWFSGFTDGEGCFTIGKRNDKHPCASYRCRCIISLRDDDRAILEEIRDTLEMGVIYDKPASTYGGRNGQPSTVFQVCSIKECAELVKVFEKYPLRAKKKRDFEIWKQAVAELVKPLDCRDADLLEYCFCKIKEVRQYEKQDELPRPEIKKLQLTIEFE